MNTRLLVASVVPALLGAIIMAGCVRKPEAPVVPAPGGTLPAGFKAEASILDLMADFVDPNADELWEAVAIVSTTTGSEERQPRTDAEWKLLRRKALVLIESANLLVTEGRVVAHPGQRLLEPGGAGDFTPAQAQAEIDKDRGAFVGFAQVLQGATVQLLGAIDKRDVDAYLEAGGTLDEACEGCHKRFWYPNSPQPPGF